MTPAEKGIELLDRIVELERERDALATIFRVNILRLAPQTTHAEIDAAIDAAKEKP